MVNHSLTITLEAIEDQHQTDPVELTLSVDEAIELYNTLSVILEGKVKDAGRDPS
jgi:hypothetical protein